MVGEGEGVARLTPRDRDRLATAGIVMAALLLGLLTTRHGVGFGDDATMQISAGLNWANGHGLRLWNGDGLTLFPPGISAVVALGDRIGLAPEQAVRIVSVASMGATAGLAFVLLRRHVHSFLMAVAGALVVVTSAELLHMTAFATSEPVFLAACVGFILVLEDLVEERGRVRPIAIAAVLTWVAFLFRYAGLSLVGIGVVVALLPVGARHWRTRCGDAAALFASSLLVPVLVMLRNRSVDGEVMGSRPASSDTVGRTVQKVLETLGEWTLPFATDNTREVAVGVLVVLAIAVVLGAYGLRAWRRSRESSAARRVPGAARIGGVTRADRSILPLAAFVVGYLGFVVLAQVSTAIEVIGTRYLSPALVPGLVLLVIAVDRVADLFPVRAQTAFRGVALAALVLYGFAHAPEMAREIRSDGWDKLTYRSDVWDADAIAQETAELPGSAVVYSNNAPGLWWSSRREPIFESPKASLANRSGGEIPVDPEFIEAAECADAYLVWFDGPPELYGAGDLDVWYSPEQLRRSVAVEEVSTHPLGTLYKLGPRADSTATC